MAFEFLDPTTRNLVEKARASGAALKARDDAFREDPSSGISTTAGSTGGADLGESFKELQQQFGGFDKTASGPSTGGAVKQPTKPKLGPLGSGAVGV